MIVERLYFVIGTYLSDGVDVWAASADSAVELVRRQYGLPNSANLKATSLHKARPKVFEPISEEQRRANYKKLTEARERDKQS